MLAWRAWACSLFGKLQQLPEYLAALAPLTSRCNAPIGAASKMRFNALPPFIQVMLLSMTLRSFCFLLDGGLGKTVGKKVHLLVPPLPPGTSQEAPQLTVRQP